MLPVVVVAVGIGCAVVARRRPSVRDRLSTASTTILAVLGAVLGGVIGHTVVPDPAAGWRGWLAAAAAVGGSLALVLAGAWLNDRALGPVRRRRESAGTGVLERIEAWSDRRPAGRRGGPVTVAVRVWRRSAQVRVAGLAAEMSYYGLISLVPLLTALGSSLGYLGRIVGDEQVAEIERTLVDAVAQVFAEQVADDVIAPLIEGLLRQERAGFAIGSVAVALWLGSRMFRAATRALDDAYRVPERRNVVGQYVLGLTLALGAVLTLVVLLSMIVVGPLLGDGQQLAERFGLGSVFQFGWSVLRWPALAVLTGGYLTLLYRYGPNIRTTWTRCLPGAVLGTLGLVLVAVGFSAYVGLTGLSAPGVDGVQTAAVAGAAEAIGMVLAGVVWLWLSSIVLLLGGVLNAELDTSVHVPADLPTADAATADRRDGTAGVAERPAR